MTGKAECNDLSQCIFHFGTCDHSNYSTNETQELGYWAAQKVHDLIDN